jgi:hypothetical protein
MQILLVVNHQYLNRTADFFSLQLLISICKMNQQVSGIALKTLFLLYFILKLIVNFITMYLYLITISPIYIRIQNYVRFTPEL